MNQELSKFEKWLVKKNEQFYDPEFGTPDFFICLFCLFVLFFSNVFLELLYKSVSKEFKIPVFSIFAIVCFAIMFIYALCFIYVFSIKAINYIPFGNKEKRLEQINAFVESNRKENKAVALEPSFIDFLIVEVKENPQEFVRKYFNSSQSFVRSYLENLYANHELDLMFLKNTMLIPRKKEINPEDFKKILIAVKAIEIDIENSRFNKIYENVDWVEFPLESVVKLYTKGFNRTDYKSAMNLLAEPFVFEKIKNVNSFREICDKIEERTLPEWVNKLKSNHFEIEVLRTKNQYDQASIDFSNCVKTYYKSPSVIFLMKSIQNPVACVCLSMNGKLLEASGKSNQKLSHSIDLEIREVLSRIS